MLQNVLYILALSFTCFLLSCAHPLVKQRTIIFGNAENEERVKYLKEKLKINSEDIETHMEMARIYLQEDMIEEAISEFKKVISIDTSNIQAHLLLSSALQKSPNPDFTKVTSLLEKAIIIAQDNADAYLNLAHVYAKMEKSKNAVNGFNKAIELSNDAATLVSAHLGLMAIYKEQGDFGRATTEYELAKKIFPGVEEMLKQAEIGRIPPVPKYAGEELRGNEDDGIHPPHEERIHQIQKEIERLSKNGK